MSNDSNKELIRRYTNEVWSQDNFQSDADFLDPNLIVHPPSPPGQIVDIVGIASMLRAALPDLVLTNEHIFGDGDRVVQHWSVSGEHRGAPLFGLPASSHRLTVSGVNIFRFVDGKISERWSIFDAAGLMQQLQANGSSS